MTFKELCYVSRNSRITVRIRGDKEWIYFPENFHNTASHDYTALSWLTKKQCREFLDRIVTHIEPTALNYLTVSLV